MERPGVRQRVKKESSHFLPNHHGKDHGRQHRVLPMQGSHLLLLLAILLAIFGVVFIFEKQLPEALMISDEPNHPDTFIAERAFNFLVGLTSIGPRVTGSYENEVLAVKYIREEISKVIKGAKPVHKVETDLQRVSGSFPLTFLDGMTQVYHNVQNVLVKVGPRTGSNHSVLMNCHFDTVSDSPGASDDGASCAIMLEVVRLVTQSDTPLKHNIVVLFNGAEENFMEASHGFITTHKWAKEIRAVVNLESCGAGGREVMFQSGPNHPWLMKIYSQTVGYPFASSLAQEIFQSGYIPGDTDFRIFRDFGGVPGLDFAWYLNGYVYHTKDDSVAHFPMGTMQRTGENIYNLVRGLANSDELGETAKHKDGNVVFFDVMGAFMMLWPLLFNSILTLGTIALSLYSISSNLKEATSRGMTRREYLRQLVGCTAYVMVSWTATLMFAVGLAVALTSLGGAMSWYARPGWIIVLYGVPAMFVPMTLLTVRAKSQREAVASPWTLFQLYYDSYQIIWTSLLGLTLLFGVQSGFIPLFWTFFPALSNVVRLRFFKHWRDWRWLPLYGVTMILPWLQCIYMILSAMQLFIPMMGRSGAGNNCEIIVALLATIMLNLQYSYVVPLILLVRNPRQIINLLSSIFIVGVAIILLTPLGFPYSGNPASLAPQRHVLLHTDRSYFKEDGTLEKQETGFWVVDLDVNSPYTVQNIVPEMKDAVPVSDDCKHRLYCGLPYFIPIISFIWKTHWIPGPPPTIPQNTTIQLLSKEKISEETQRLHFHVTGPDHMGLILCPKAGLELKSWSLLEGEPLAGPLWHGRKTFFVYYSYASEAGPWIFHLDFKVPRGYDGKLVDLALTSHFVHGVHQKSKELLALFSKYPDWATVSGWQSTYKSFIF